MGWHGGGFTGYFTSYEGMKSEAVSARTAAETAASDAAASWRDMTLTPGSALSLGAVRATELPAGELTGYGIFADEGAGVGGAIRITDLNVYC